VSSSINPRGRWVNRPRCAFKAGSLRQGARLDRAAFGLASQLSVDRLQAAEVRLSVRSACSGRHEKYPGKNNTNSFNIRFLNLLKMINPFSTKPSSKVSTEDLKRRETLIKAVLYVAAFFLVANLGYNIFLLVSHKVDSLNELVGRNSFSMGGFGASLLLSSYALKKIKAELSGRD